MAAEDQVQPFNNFTAYGMTSVPIRTGAVNGYIEAAGQSWQPGAPLISSSGSIAEAADDVTTGIIGFAAYAASGTTGAYVDLIPAVPGIEFECNLEDQSAGDHALVQANLFTAYAIRQRTANGAWYADENDTTNDAVIVVAFRDPVGTVQARVRVRLLDTVTIYND